MKKVVIIAYGFPPVGGAGVQRPVKFVKYLREFGWEPVVLTVENPSVPVLDQSLMLDIPEGMALYKAKTLEPSYAKKQSYAEPSSRGLARWKHKVKGVVLSCMLPDLQILWWPGLVARLVKVISKERPNCLFVSAPPFSSFLPVLFIGSLLGVPVVIDFRDEWAFSRNSWEHSAKHWVARTLDQAFESYAVRTASAFTTANQSYLDSLGQTHRRGASGKGYVITNGYDESDFESLPDCAGRRDQPEVVMIYAGTVWNATSLRPFIGALKPVLQEDGAGIDGLVIKVFGRVVDNEKGYFEDPEVKHVVQLCGYQDHAAVAREIARADILLITLSDLPGSHKIVTGKVFEYMATGKHILAIVPDGETQRIVAQYANSTIVGPDDPERIGGALRSLLANISQIRRQTGNDVSHYSRKFLTGKLAEVFEKVIAG